MLIDSPYFWIINRDGEPATAIKFEPHPAENPTTYIKVDELKLYRAELLEWMAESPLDRCEPPKEFALNIGEVWVPRGTNLSLKRLDRFQ